MTDYVEQVIAEALFGAGLSDKPDEFDSNIHSWRCEHPGRYGRCKCFEGTVADLIAALRAANMLRETGVPDDAPSEDDREALIAVVKRNRSVVKRMSDGYPSVVFVTDETIADAILAAGFSRAAAPAAATEAKQPEGWSTEDRQESKQEAERRWVDERSGYKSDYNRGCINGFILGAEWQKARETFISFRSIADEARAERDAALAAVERVRVAKHEVDSVHQIHGADCLCGYSSARSRSRTEHITEAMLAALDGAPEPENDDPCDAEVYSWDHYRPEQIDSYWIRCTLLGKHDEHEDSHTGLKWRSGLPVEGESDGV